MKIHISIPAVLLATIVAGCDSHKELARDVPYQASERLERLDFERWPSFQGVKDGEARIEWRSPKEEPPEGKTN